MCYRFWSSLSSHFCTLYCWCSLSSNKDTWKLKHIHIAFSSYFTRVTWSLSISSASAHSYTSFCWLVWIAFHSSGCHISSVRSDGHYPVSFFLSGCLEPLFCHWVPFPCIHMLLLSVSFILMHILWRHNHWDIVSQDVLRLCVVSAFCMSYLVCDAFQDAWCVLSYFGNCHCREASQPETIEVTLSRFFSDTPPLFYFIMMLDLFTWNTFNWCGSWL